MKTCEACAVVLIQRRHEGAPAFSRRRFCSRACLALGMCRLTYNIDSNGCWIWPSVDRDGYGMVRRQGRIWRAHRYFYTQVNGPIPAEVVLDHLCFVRACVNPDHLRPLSRSENAGIKRPKVPAA